MAWNRPRSLVARVALIGSERADRGIARDWKQRSAAQRAVPAFSLCPAPFDPRRNAPPLTGTFELGGRNSRTPPAPRAHDERAASSASARFVACAAMRNVAAFQDCPRIPPGA